MALPHEHALGAHPSGRSLTTLPGPRGLPLLGNLLQLRATKLHTILEQWADRYGPLYTLRLGRRPVLAVAEPDLIHTVLRQRPETYRRLRSLAALFADIGGEGVFVAEGARWRRQRRVVMQALHPAQVRQFFPTVDAVTARLQARWDQDAVTGTPIDLPTALMAYTAEVTTRLTFGDIPTLAGSATDLQQHLAQILPMLNRRGSALVPYWRYMSLPADRALARTLATLQTMMAACIADGRRRLAQDAATPPALTTVLEALLVARDEDGSAFSDTEIMSNLLTMLVAGEDTTAHTMAWMLHFMTELPWVQHLMQQEVDDVLGAARRLPDVPTQDRLGYVDAVAQETMRLKSVAPLLFVEPTRPVELGGMHLPTGTPVFLLTRHMGLQEHAFPAAGTFQPERWLSTAPASPRDRPSPTLVPFGGGPRVCPGRTLALLEIKAVMTMLCRSFTVTKLDTPSPVQEHFAFTMMPTPFKILLRPRV